MLLGSLMVWSRRIKNINEIIGCKRIELINLIWINIVFKKCFIMFMIIFVDFYVFVFNVSCDFLIILFYLF